MLWMFIITITPKKEDVFKTSLVMVVWTHSKETTCYFHSIRWLQHSRKTDKVSARVESHWIHIQERNTWWNQAVLHWLGIMLIGFSLWHILQVDWSLRPLCNYLPSSNSSKSSTRHSHENTRCRSCISTLLECGTTVSWPEQLSSTTPYWSTEEIAYVGGQINTYRHI